MADVQIENGYIKIANELFEAFARIRIAGEARQVLDVILRKTYGYGKKEDRISLSQFCLATYMSKTRVCQALIKLYRMNLITKKGNDLGSTYGFNKDFDTWKPLPKKEILNNHYQKRKSSLPKIGHTKDILTIDKRYNTYAHKNNNAHVIAFWFNEFWDFYPKKTGKKAALKAWHKIKLSEELIDKISEALKTQKKSADWIKEKGKYIPYPATWLNGERWNDETTR